MRQTIIAVFLSLGLAACGGQDKDQQQVDYESLRGQGDKADGFINKSHSCQGLCGGLAWDYTGFCGCDEVCATYGDCCDDKAAVCDGVIEEVIVITESQNGQTVNIEVGDTIDVQLHGNISSGYSWELLASNRSFPLQKEEYVPDQPIIAGSGGTFHFYFTADSFSSAGVFPLQFAEYREWEGVGNAVKTFNVTITVGLSKESCLALNDEYQQELAASQGCSIDGDCGTFVGGDLKCGFPHKAINSIYETQVKAYHDQWTSEGCYQLPWNCPMMMPLPPWYEVRGVCNAGTCEVEYVDTRAKAGHACGPDINVTCGENLYCAFGLNWCGTPPVTGICRPMGECGAVSDCENADNLWYHPMCTGSPTCEN